MKTEILDKAIETSVLAGQIGAGAGRMKEVVTNAMEDGIRSAKHAARDGRRAVDDLVDDARYKMKHHPFGTAGISFAVGLGLGTVTGILLARASRTRS